SDKYTFFVIMKFKIACTLFVACALAACQTTEKTHDATAMSEADIQRMADSLAQAFIIIDGHVDLPYRLADENFKPEGEDLQIPVHSDDGDFDFERARKGGLDAPFMSIYIPSSNQKTQDMGKGLAEDLIAMVEGIAREIPDKFALARTPDDIVKNTSEGKISLPMGMENGAPIGNDLANVRYFFDRGIRYITLTHGKDNQICDSSYDTTATWSGLSPFGEEVVAEMNRV